MATADQLESALVKADAAGDTEAASILARELRTMRATAPTATPQQAMAEHAKSLDYKMAVAGATPAQTFPQYAGQALKEMAIPMATTAAGGAMGGLPGAMAGSALGETLNQALEISGPRSVIPELDKPNLSRVGLMAAAPAVVPAVVGAGRAIKGAGRVIAENVIPQRFANAWLKKNVGEYGDDAAMLLRDKMEKIPGYPATVAEKVAGTPAGAVLQAHQKIVAKTPGGISSDFGQRVLDQKQAIAEAMTSRDMLTEPMRTTALQQAGTRGVKTDAVLSGIQQIEGTPGVRASGVVQKTVGSIREKLASLTNPNGIIDPEDLYTVRKEIGNVIQTHAKDTANWDKRLASGLQRDIQKSMDDAIEAAGGAGWKDYLQTFAGKSKSIEDTLARQKLAGRPLQQTSLPGGVNIAPSGTEHLLPNWLSKPVTGTKWLAGRYAERMEPKIDRYMANLYLGDTVGQNVSHERLANVLQTQPPSRAQLMIDAILKRQAPVAAGAATQMREN